MCVSRETALAQRFFAYALRRSAGTSFSFAENRSCFSACAAKPHYTQKPSLAFFRLRRKPAARATALKRLFFASGKTAPLSSPALNCN
jgi:hypothetical protein